MKKLIVVFGAILFASVVITSCGGKEADFMVDTLRQGEDTIKTDTDMSVQFDDTTKKNTEKRINSILSNDDSENNLVNSEKETSQLEKDAIIFTNILCEMKGIEDRLENTGSEEEFNKTTAELVDLEKKYKSLMNYMPARYPDETSEEVLEIKRLLKVLLLDCYSEDELERMFSKQ